MQTLHRHNAVPALAVAVAHRERMIAEGRDSVRIYWARCMERPPMQTTLGMVEGVALEHIELIRSVEDRAAVLATLERLIVRVKGGP